jgi:hypothetical protein
MQAAGSSEMGKAICQIACQSFSTKLTFLPYAVQRDEQMDLDAQLSKRLKWEES